MLGQITRVIYIGHILDISSSANALVVQPLLQTRLLSVPNTSADAADCVCYL